MGEDQVRVLLRNLDPYQSTGPDGRHPEVLRELVDELASLWPVNWPFPIVFERSWRSRKVPYDWRETKVISIFKHVKKDNPRNYRVVILTSVPGKIIERSWKQFLGT